MLNIFEGCSGLTSLTIPANVAKINSKAFVSSPLRNVVVKSVSPPQLSSAFNTPTTNSGTLYIPCGTSDAYAFDGAWCKFINRREQTFTSEDLSATNVYTLMNTSDFGYMVYDSVNDELRTGVSISGIDESNLDHCWQMVEVKGQTYLYNMGAKKFLVPVEESGNLTLVDEALPITMDDGEDGVFLAKYQNVSWGFVVNNKIAAFKDLDIIVTTPNKYKLTYIVDGEIYKAYELESGAVITPEEEPTKEGYTFSGWIDIPETMSKQDVTITGSFAINSYKLTYIVDSETYRTYEVKYGADITVETEPTKEGFNFSGWSEIPETMPAHDITITGSFTKAKYKLAYIVDGIEYQSDEHEAGESISLITAPEKENQMFIGWSMEMPVGDVTLTAIYVPVNSIDGVRASSDSFQIFTPDGIRHNVLQKGVNILRYSDGTEKKVVIQ